MSEAPATPASPASPKGAARAEGSARPALERLDLGRILLETTRLTEEQLAEARERQAESGRRLADLLVAEGLVSADEVLEALGRQLDLPIRPNIRADVVDETLVERVPIGFCKHHVLLPLQRDADGAVRVAVADPLALEPIDDLRMLFEGNEVRLELANQRTILGAINEVYDRGPGSTDALAEDAADDLDHLAEEISHEPQDLLDASDDAPIIKLVNSMLQHAVKERASDVHLEPFEREIRVRFRIDDVLYEPMKPLPRALQASIVSRIKIMGGLNIAEKRLPQDGRIRLKIAGRDYDVRLSTIPISHGERVVMRLLPRTQDLQSLERIGFNEQQLAVMERLLTRPNGIILVTGPTGSGKTTTLYAGLSRINATDKNIITIEDPVEIQLTGVGQIEVKPQIGLTFASGLRSVLRQDPNVILVGEIRDLETAEIAIQASLTGHLVFSTLHTNDAASAITRLVDMGVEPFLVASSLVAVLAQRLVRVLCKDCREAYEASREELAEIGVRPPERPVRVYRPEGCAGCNYTGYHGRVGIFELMLVDDDLRGMVSQNIDSKSIKQKAQQKGMHTLRTDGARKVLQGITSVAEVMRATEEEGVVAQV
ncbi:MAG: type II secretion system ATPase GspE [Deltaproteobacteria bacterium]|nr:type II secretion system ATPase GspE [Deltaproteobacteria bacterium]